MRRFIIGSVVLLILSVPTFSQSKQRDTTALVPEITFMKGDSLSFLASTLRNVTQARIDLRENRLPDAHEALKRAHLLIKLIMASSPTSQAKDFIWVAKNHLSYEDIEKVIQDLLPIYSSLNNMQNKQSAEQGREHVKKAEKLLEGKNRDEARVELELADKALVYSTIDLNLSIAADYIAIAQDYVTRNEPGKAEESLKNADNELQFIVVDLYAPLPQAQRSLWEATKDSAAREYVALKNDLEEAKAYLDKTIEKGETKSKAEARELLKDLEVLKNKAEKREKIEQKYIGGLWERTKALAERDREYSAFVWKKLHTISPVKQYLIDAKLHVSYARTYHLTTREPDKAKIEIDKAEGYLNDAMSRADEATKAQLLSMEKELKELKSELNKKDIAIMARYDAIENRLDEMIRKI